VSTVPDRAPAPASPAGVAPAAGGAAAERAFCRAMLPRVSRTFALNIRLLGGSMCDAVRIAYLMCRIADTIEDAWPGERREIERRFDQLIAAVAGSVREGETLAAGATALRGRASEAHVELVSRAAEVLRAFAVLAAADRAAVAEAVTTMSMGMRRYAGRAAERAGGAGRPAWAGGAARAGAATAVSTIAAFAYLDDDAELKDYCWIVAGCVGVMLTGLVARRSPSTPAVEARRLTLAPSVGEGLQLTNILLDWPHDVRRGRCYLPATWLAEEGLTPDELVGAPRPGISRLAERLEHRALEALDAVPEYVASWPASQFRYRQFCLWPSLWALASLDHARRDPEFPWAEHRPRMPRATLWRSALAAVALGHGDSGVLALFRDFRPRSKAAGREPRTHP